MEDFRTMKKIKSDKIERMIELDPTKNYIFLVKRNVLSMADIHELQRMIKRMGIANIFVQMENPDDIKVIEQKI